MNTMKLKLTTNLFNVSIRDNYDNIIYVMNDPKDQYYYELNIKGLTIGDEYAEFDE